jgi:hypothetical protein
MAMLGLIGAELVTGLVMGEREGGRRLRGACRPDGTVTDRSARQD